MGSWTIGSYTGKVNKTDIEDAVRNELEHGYNSPIHIRKIHIKKLGKYDNWNYVTHALCDVKTEKMEYTIVYTVLAVCEDGEIIGKIFDESAGPNYAEYCPITFLKDLTEPVNGYAVDWREKVKAANREKTTTLADRRYRIGQEEIGIMEIVERTCIPLSHFEKSRIVKRQKIGGSIIANGIEFWRIA